MHDRYGNPVDESVDYARGKLLASSADEYRRYMNAQSRIRTRIEEHGTGSMAVLTGNQREFPIVASDLGPLTEEWMGPARFAEDLRLRVLDHMGGSGDDAVAVVNRTSAGLVAATSLLGVSGVISLAPGGGPHPSVRRGSALASPLFTSCRDVDEFERACLSGSAGLAVITPTTSELESLEVEDLIRATRAARTAGLTVLVDDAYGGRIRPVLQDGPLSLGFGADLAITNADKAGLPGPRAGMMAGDHRLVRRVQARAAEWGMEARAPIALAVLRSVEGYSPQHLRDEVEAGRAAHEALAALIGTDRVSLSPLGPVVGEEDAWALVTERAGHEIPLVPCEVTAAMGMLLLDQGLLTVNACGQPGARVSLRIKAGPADLARAGGPVSIAEHILAAASRVADLASDTGRIAELLFGRE